MRTLCFGGTFNPIHHGHLICARAAAEAAGFDRVLLIPSANPPLRSQEQDLITATNRLTMCQLAVEGLPFFAVSDLELHRSEPSYTIDTARMLRSQGHHNVFFLIGLDNVPQLHRWREPAALMREVQFLVMRRPGTDLNWDDIQEPFRSLRQSMVTAPLIEISATDIRQRVKENRPIDFLVPPAVANYIKESGLYR